MKWMVCLGLVPFLISDWYYLLYTTHYSLYQKTEDWKASHNTFVLWCISVLFVQQAHMRQLFHRIFLCTYIPLCFIKEMPLQIEVVVLSEVFDKQSVCTWCRMIDVSATTIHIWLCSRLLRRNVDCDYMEHTSALGTSRSRGVSSGYRLWCGLYEGVVNEARDTVRCVIK